jgi:hypothetical protein
MLGRKTETKLKKNLKPKFGNDALENADLGFCEPTLANFAGKVRAWSATLHTAPPKLKNPPSTAYPEDFLIWWT